MVACWVKDGLGKGWVRTNVTKRVGLGLGLGLDGLG